MNILSIEKLARDADAVGDVVVVTPFLERFAALVRAEVLEEAVKVCYDMQNGWPSDDHIQCGDAIKALKQNL